MDQSQQWKSIFSNNIDWDQVQNTLHKDQKRRKQNQINRNQKRRPERATMVICATHLDLQRKYGFDSITCKPMQERSIYKHYLSHMYPTRDNELAFGLKYGFHDINQKRMFYLASEVIDNEPIANLPELETSQFDQWKTGKDENYCFFKEMNRKKEEFEKSRDKHNEMAQKLAEKDNQFAIVSTYWKVMNQNDQQPQKPITTNTNNVKTNNNNTRNNTDNNDTNNCNTNNSNNINNSQCNSLCSDNESNAASEHQSDDDIINDMTETMKNWNEKKTERKNTIYNIDNGAFDYDINKNDKEYQSLFDCKPNWQQTTLDFYVKTSENQMEIDTNTDDDDIDIEIEFESNKMESNTLAESLNINDNNINLLDNDIAMNENVSNDTIARSIINEYEAKLEAIQCKLDAMKSEKELAEIRCLCFEDMLLKLSDMCVTLFCCLELIVVYLVCLRPSSVWIRVFVL